MKLNLTIREKLVVFYVALGFFAISIVGAYSFMSAREAILKRSFDHLTSVREVKKARLTHFLQDRIREVEMLAHMQTIENVTILESKNNESIIEKNIREFLVKGNYYKTVFIILDSKKFLTSEIISDTLKNGFSISNKPLKSPFKQMFDVVSKSRKTQFFDIVHWKNESELMLATPIQNSNNNRIGVLVVGIPIAAINDIMLEKNSFGGLGSSGESYLVAKDYLMRSSSRFHDKSILQTKVNTEAVEHAFHNEYGTNIIKDYRGVSVLSSYAKISILNLEWAILAEIDFIEVMKPVFATRNDIVVMSVIIIFIMSIFAFIISRKITTPLLKLRTLAIDIAKGNYGKTIAIETLDEVGELTDSFNIMSIQINEQTKELREREKRLQHFYQATTDGIVLHNRGSILLINQAIVNLTQYSTDELMNFEINKILHLLNSEKIKEQKERSFVFETECLRKDGNRFPVEVIENPIEYEGKVVSAYVIRNITERIDAQNKLQEERKKRLTSFIDGQEDERKRLSRELHDGLGQSLVGIKLRLETLRLISDEKNSEVLEMVKSFVNQTIQDVRRVSNNLMPSALRDIGLKLAIERLCRETENSSGIVITFDAETVTKIPDDRVKSYLYRITQEAINNAVKHSQATEMSIMLVQEPTKVRLIIEDNGIGFDEDNLVNRGNGLYSLRERVAILNGNINISSSPGKGVYIDVRLPIPKKVE